MIDQSYSNRLSPELERLGKVAYERQSTVSNSSPSKVPNVGSPITPCKSTKSSSKEADLQFKYQAVPELKFDLAATQCKRRSGNIAMKHEEYLAKARQNLKRTKALIDAEVPKSLAWKRLRRAYIAQEVRIRNRIKLRDRKLAIDQFDEAMEFIMNSVSKLVNAATFDKI